MPAAAAQASLLLPCFFAAYERVSPDAVAPARRYTDWRGGTLGVAGCRFIASPTRSSA